ncbi:hypothetical protein MKEN_00614500 [Mycena kentingensis (nom. inval.)]|nr:hypothetical protein MKEN_00614500 [Mycena kentingensis (nom. inval.)]
MALQRVLAHLDGIEIEIDSLTLVSPAELQILRKRLSNIHTRLGCSILTKLPTEIITEISLCCGAHFPDHAAVLLASVSREWRQLTLGLPALWAHIVVPWKLGKQRDFIEMFMRRSGVSPLRVTLCMEDIETSFNTRTMVDAVFRTIEWDRVQRLHLEIPVSQIHLIHAVAAKVVNPTLDFPALEELTLRFTGPSRLWDALVFDQIFSPSTTPRLREVTLHDAPPGVLSFSWAAVTEFTGMGGVLEQSLDAVNLAPNMHRCTICGTHPDSDTRGRLSLVKLHDLLAAPLLHQALKEVTLQSDEALGFIECVNLPALESLEIAWQSVSLDAELFKAFLTRSTPPIKQLTLRGMNDTSPGVDLTEALPALRGLPIEQLHIAPLDSSLKLIDELRDPSFLPCIRKLELGADVALWIDAHGVVWSARQAVKVRVAALGTESERVGITVSAVGLYKYCPRWVASIPM